MFAFDVLWRGQATKTICVQYLMPKQAIGCRCVKSGTIILATESAKDQNDAEILTFWSNIK